MEEERRLCYVAMTRARRHLTLTTARQRMLYGRTTNNMPSRFLEEIPSETLDWQGKQEPRPARGDWEEDAGRFSAGRAFDRQGRGEIPASRPHRGAAAPQRELSAAAGFTGAAAAAKGGPLLPLQKGDRIRHRTFGEGLVLSLRPMGNDALVEVAFDTAGTKKLMLRTAGAHITKLS